MAIELNNILHYWFQKRSNDFSSCVATLLLRWNAYTFIYRLNKHLIYGIHHFLLGLLGYLILFATRAFVPQRQLLDKRLLSPLPVVMVSTEFQLYSINTPLLIYNSSIIVSCLRLIIPSRYPLNLLKMNNTSLLRITATAGT